MWYWIVMASLMFIMLVVVNKKATHLFLVLKVIIFATLLVFITWGTGFSSSSHMWIGAALGFFVLCDLFEACSFWSKKWQLTLFSLACFCYSFDFWLHIDTITWPLPVFLFALFMVSFLLLLPLLEQFAITALMIAGVLWQLSWAAGEVWQADKIPLNLISFMGSILLAISVLIWSIHHFKHPIKHYSSWLVLTYFGAHTLIVSNLVLVSPLH